MPFSPLLTPTYPRAPVAFAVANGATGKTNFADNSNAATLVGSDADRIRALQDIFVQPTATPVAGRLMLFLYNGTTAFQVDDIVHAASTISTTANGFSALKFSKFSAASPLIVPVGWSVLFATSVNQTAGIFVAHALGKEFGQ